VQAAFKYSSMIKIKKHGVILEPTRREFEQVSTFNPAIYQEGNDVHVVYRAQDGDYLSTFGYARLKGATRLAERHKEPLYTPKYGYEKRGIEDACLVKIDDTFYMTYVAHDGIDAVIAYMHGPDLFNLERGGIISTKISYRKAAKLFPYSKLKDDYYMFAAYYEKYGTKNILVWEKDGVLFPEKIRGKFAMLHRVLPDIQLIRFSDFYDLKDTNFWHDHLQHLGKHVVLEGRYGYESRHIGGGAPPIKTKRGWIMIYHAVQHRNQGRVYYAAAALLDLKNPRKVIARLPYPLIAPDQPYEKRGHVNNVVFPTGTAVFKDQLYIYYGTSDKYVAVASLKINNLIKELLKYKEKPNKPFQFYES
jgi:predicted GH43/DUF377 family glycosyl hydrolase